MKGWPRKYQGERYKELISYGKCISEIETDRRIGNSCLYMMICQLNFDINETLMLLTLTREGKIFRGLT